MTICKGKGEQADPADRFRPLPFDGTREVTAAVIFQDERVLIAQRGAGRDQAGKWEFPGGKIEPGESPEDCLQREIKEELGINIAVDRLFSENVYSYETGAIRLMAFSAKWTGGKLQPNEHSQVKWVSREELGRFDFAPADRPFVLKLMQDWRTGHE